VRLLERVRGVFRCSDCGRSVRRCTRESLHRHIEYLRGVIRETERERMAQARIMRLSRDGKLAEAQDAIVAELRRKGGRG